MPENLKNKAVRLTLETAQKIEDQRERDQIAVDATLYEKEGSHHILYQENQTKTHIRISEEMVHIHRLGELSGDLWFVAGDQRDTRYETPYGRMILTIDTHRIDWDPKGLRLYIRYNILSGDQRISLNEITIKMEEVEKA